MGSCAVYQEDWPQGRNDTEIRRTNAANTKKKDEQEC